MFSGRRISGLPLTVKNRYFRQQGADRFAIGETLRQKLCFVQGNIIELEKMPAMAVDLIYCQNVLVYFRRARRQRVLNALVDRLKPGGLLVVGPGDDVGWQHPDMQRTGDIHVQAYARRSQQTEKAEQL